MVQRATVSSRLLGNYLRAMGTSILAIPTDLPHSLHQSMDTLKLCSYCWTTVLIRATTTSEIALHCATAFGDYSEAAGILLDLNLDESSQNNNGSTPLHRAAQGSLRVKRTGSSCWTTAQIFTGVVRESVSAGPTFAHVCYVFTVSCLQCDKLQPCLRHGLCISISTYFIYHNPNPYGTLSMKLSTSILLTGKVALGIASWWT